MKSKLLTIIAAAMLLLSINSFAQSPVDTLPNETGNFIAVSDIHFNPFSTCQKNNPNCLIVKLLVKNEAGNWANIFSEYDAGTTSAYHADTNYPLLKSTLATLHNQTLRQSPEFVIMLGDFLAHDFQQNYQYYSGDTSQTGYQAFVKKTLQFLTAEIKTAIPNILVYPALGNNDSYNGDYGSVPNGMFYKDTASLWQPLVGQQAGTFDQTFPVAGYYAVAPPATNNIRLIILNSVLFTPKAYDAAVDKAAQQELSWLAQQLTLARKQQQKVWLLMHVPPGINVYNTVVDPAKKIDSFWQPEYLQAFLSILKPNADTITALLTSHVHMDGFQIISLPKTIPDSFVPGISPMFGNNPGFKIYSYAKQSLQLQNFATYYLADNNTVKGWQLEYSFNAIYQPNCTICTLINGMQNIAPHGYLAQAYQRFYAASNMNAQPITKGKWLPYYWCGIHLLAEEEYYHCINSI